MLVLFSTSTGYRKILIQVIIRYENLTKYKLNDQKLNLPFRHTEQQSI